MQGAGEKVMQMYIGSRRGSSDKDAPISLAALPAPKDPKVRVSIAGGELLAVARFEVSEHMHLRHGGCHINTLYSTSGDLILSI
jgi:hypothetical protein